MANEEHLKILKQGVEIWNRWRKENLDVWPDLRGADLRDSYLSYIDLRNACLDHAIFCGSVLRGSDLSESSAERADFSCTNLSDANLYNTGLNIADLTNAILRNANLHEANLWGAVLYETNLSRANFSNVELYQTVLGNLDLSNVRGLETCKHSDASVIDHRTLARSGPLPLSFLRGIGLPDTFIDYIPSLFNQPLQFYSCFISYSSRDEEFAQRLHADLQGKGVRCWYAPEDLPIGAKIRVGIDQAIRKHDKLLLVLSEHSVKSQWVEQEVETALEKERQRDQLVLFPVRLDNAVMDSGDGWTRLIKNTRNIGDFTRWKDYDAYQKGLDRLVRDLKASLASKGDKA